MTDRRTVFVVTIALAMLCIGGLGSVVALTLFNKAIPDLVSNVVTTALGALAALLASTRSDPGQLPAADPSVADHPDAVTSQPGTVTWTTTSGPVNYTAGTSAITAPPAKAPPMPAPPNPPATPPPPRATEASPVPPSTAPVAAGPSVVVVE